MTDYTTNPDSDNLENRDSDTQVVKELMRFCASNGYGVFYRDVNDWVAFALGETLRTAWPTRAAAYTACLNLIIMDRITAVRNE